MIASETHDGDLIRKAVVRNWHYVSDDSSGRPEDFEPVHADGVHYVLIRDRRPRGVFMYHRHNAITYEVHTCPLDGLMGHDATTAARLSLGWMFANTDCLKVITHVPRPNLLAYRFALRVGMVDEGVNRESFLKDGQVHDQFVLGITKGEFGCQQQHSHRQS